MEIMVNRIASDEEATLGELQFAGAVQCFTLEDQGRDGPKVPRETRIPAGRYRLKLRRHGGFHERYAKRFADIHCGMIELEAVPGFTDILIHCGNTEADTAGCLLVGQRHGLDERGHHAVQRSTAAYVKIYPPITDAIEREEAWLTIADEP